MRWGSCASHSFALVFLSQTVCAMAQGFSLGAPPRIAALWFPEAEWGLATGIGVFANQLGPAVAYYLVPDVVTGTNGDGMNVLLEGTFYCTIAALALVVVAIPEAPARPPSALAAKRDETAAPTFKAFCRNCADLYLSPVTGAGVSLLSLGYGAAVGVLYALSTDLEVLLPDLSTHGVSVVGGAFISAGLPGALGGGAILDFMVVKRFRGLSVAMARRRGVMAIALDSGTLPSSTSTSSRPPARRSAGSSGNTHACDLRWACLIECHEPVVKRRQLGASATLVNCEVKDEIHMPRDANRRSVLHLNRADVVGGHLHFGLVDAFPRARLVTLLRDPASAFVSGIRYKHPTPLSASTTRPSREDESVSECDERYYVQIFGDCYRLDTTFLDLSYNDIGGPIPTEFGLLTGLARLRAHPSVPTPARSDRPSAS
ncbi:hypothetical protein JL721_4300 [Aureococcus anophagefferens]|nr:hypothetical protein JL721_4300 [Aureococcus anophagefferens]